MMENPSLDFFTAMDLGEAAMSGNVSTTFLNEMFAAAGLMPPFTPETQAMLPRGVSYLLMGKSAVYSDLGSRYFIVKDTFDLFAAAGYVASGGASQEVYGAQQFAWLGGTLLASPATWKVLGHSFMMAPLVFDFTNPLIAAMLPPGFPDFLRTKMLINGEDFNGLPQKTMELLGMGEIPGLLDLVDNVVVISGDIHATFVTDHLDGVYEVTPPAISSATNGEIMMRAALAHPILSQIPGIEDILANNGLLLQISAANPAVSPSSILYQNTWSHGYGIMDVTADAFTVLIQEIPSDEIGTSYYDDPEALNELFTPIMFSIQDGVLVPGP
jgi:alkaline phosphatase D